MTSSWDAGFQTDMNIYSHPGLISYHSRIIAILWKILSVNKDDFMDMLIISPTQGRVCFLSMAKQCFSRNDFRFAPSQWDTALLCNDASHCLAKISPVIVNESCRHIEVRIRNCYSINIHGVHLQIYFIIDDEANTQSFAWKHDWNAAAFYCTLDNSRAISPG